MEKAKREVLGYLDCPTCGTKDGVRFTLDKNGDPYGYCEGDCSQQWRVGGSKYRVGKFIERYPWAGKPPVTVTEKTDPEPAIDPVPEPKPPVSVPVPTKKRGGMAEALELMGIRA